MSTTFLASECPRAASTLPVSEALTQSILNSVASQIVVLDGRGVICAVNKPWQRFALENGSETGEAARRTGIGVDYLAVCRESDGDSSEGTMAVHNGIRAVLDGQTDSFSLEYPCHSPVEQRWFLMQTTALENGKPGAVISHTDITKRKLAEDELKRHHNHLEALVCERTAALQKANEAAEVAHRASEKRLILEADARMQSRKIEAVGTLAAGIAHDFNNILGSIVGFAEMTLDALPIDSDNSRNVSQILTASSRARNLVARLLAFARQSPLEPVPVDIVSEVSVALALLRASLRPSVQFSFRSSIGEASAAAILLADPTQIQQIVMNLCINAAHAMDNNGTITICIDAAATLESAPPELSAGVCLSVIDSGSGMSPEVLERMFDPFFTTKAPDEGSGLGLSVVYGIVTSLGGIIKTQSRTYGSTKGTEFRVFLPLKK
jgi:signal transduction histidine kinase